MDKSKDPAFLFYTGDFSTGTQFFTDEQVGKYVRLLMAQHQHGHLYEKHMIQICKTHDKDIFAKFKQDVNGLYFNQRLEDELVKRKKYSESRSKNRKNKNISSSHEEDMENEDIIINTNKVRNGREPKFSGNFKAQSEELFAARDREHRNNLSSDRTKDSQV